jgi:hypothetical protein
MLGCIDRVDIAADALSGQKNRSRSGGKLRERGHVQARGLPERES